MENIRLFELQNEFYHVAQPIVDLITNKIYGYEALLRSKNHESPEILFTEAEQQNKLFELDMFSVYKVFHMIRKYERFLDDERIFINIFPSTIVHSGFHSMLENLVSEVGVSKERIIFEINESSHRTDFSKLIKSVEKLKRDCFYIALDDIGKREATLMAILEMEPHIAKIDKYFAKDLAHSLKKQQAMRSILNFFQENTIVIVEGIETEEDLIVAKGLGAKYGQGFYLGKPKLLEQH